MANFYCEYCGAKFPSIQSLTSSYCQRHPNGQNKGKHKPYVGDEKSEYFCKYCGTKFPSIQSMTNSYCQKHPNGQNKGKHAPAL